MRNSTKNEEFLQILEKIVWKSRPKCPYCKAEKYTVTKHGKRYHCNTCNTTYSVLVGTFLQGSKVDLRKWFYLIQIWGWGKLLSARKLAKLLKVNKNSANLMIMKLRNANAEQRLLISQIFTEYETFFESNEEKGLKGE